MGCLSGAGGGGEKTTQTWWQWREKNENVAVVEVYSFTIHGTVLK